MALTLFEEQGFAETTMEQIAAAAEVGTSTLYRYFPAKHLLLDEAADEWRGFISAELATRPTDEQPGEALAAAVISGLAQAARQSERVRRLRNVLDNTPVARARLWDIWDEEHAMIVENLAARCALDPDDRRLAFAATQAIGIVSLSLDEWRRNPGAAAPDDLARAYIDMCGGPANLVPAL